METLQDDPPKLGEDAHGAPRFRDAVIGSHRKFREKARDHV